jgi:hypothetical protein
VTQPVAQHLAEQAPLEGVINGEVLRMRQDD